MGVRYCVWDVVLFTGMVIMEGCGVGLTIMTKTDMARGMSPFVFVLYTNALTSLILLPSSFIFYRPKPSCFTFSLLTKFFFLGLTGISLAQSCAFTGLSYSSPIVVCSMGNLIPALSFLLSIIFRMGKVDLRRSTSKAKSVGTLISIMGALTVTLYKGPPIRKTSSSSTSHQLSLSPQPTLLYASTPENWVLGGLLLATASLSASVGNIVQAATVKEYPEVMSIVTFYSLFGTIQCAIVSLIAERDPSAWKLRNYMELLNIVLSAVFGSVIRSGFHAWCMSRKGHVYVAMFKPFGIVFAVTVGLIFFGDSLHFGSVIGAFIIAMGYYSIMWGQIQEEEMSEVYGDGSLESSSHKIPLLQGDMDV